MTSARILWLTRGRRAGTFGEFSNAQADAIVAADMGQEVKGRASHQFRRYAATDEDYPTGATDPADPQPDAPKPQPKPAKGATKTRQSRAADGAKPGRGRHARRDMRPEE